MGNRNFKNINMKYLTLRWFTLNCFNECKLHTFHTLEMALNTAGIKNKNLCWYEQTENYLKQEFKKILLTQYHQKEIFKKFENDLQKFFTANNLEPKLFLENINFMHKCDEIIYHKSHTAKTLQI